MASKKASKNRGKSTTVRNDSEGLHTVRLSKSRKVSARSDEAAIERIKRNLRKMSKDPDISDIYIGKTSAPTGSDSAAYKAMKTRYDENKDEMGITNMNLQYITKSDRYIDNAEKKLIEYNKRTKKAANERGGGGGAPTDQPYKILYIGYKTKGKGKKR